MNMFLQKLSYKLWKHLDKKHGPGSRSVVLDSGMYQRLFMQPIVVQHHQKIFPKYRAKYRNRDFVLLATGPTLKYFSASCIKNALYCGVNQVVLSDNFKLDYHFVTDYGCGLRDKAKEVASCKTRSKRFIGIMPFPINPDHPYNIMQFPIPYIDDCKADYFFITESNIFNWDISLFPFNSYASVVFPALQFICYTQPRRIYIVGCDCSGTHFNSDIPIPDQNVKSLQKYWTLFKKQKAIWYPDIEIVSVNPIGLKGMFTDVYTQAFLDQHPEIKRENLTVL